MKRRHLAILLSVLLFACIVSAYIGSWEYYANRKVIVSEPVYETMPRPEHEIIGNFVLILAFSFGISVVAYVFIGAVLEDC